MSLNVQYKYCPSPTAGTTLDTTPTTPVPFKPPETTN